jgi:hypothetical protein
MRPAMSRATAITLTIAAAILIVAVAVLDPPPPKPDPPGAFSFAVLGDAPYYPLESLRYRVVRQSLDAHELAFVIHIGDIWWRPCSDRMYRRTLRQFEGLRHPVVYTPGDNEWTDCWEEGSGGHAPLERLARLRQIFYDAPSRIPLQRQGGEFIENARWRHADVVFATVHLTGSYNAMKAFPGRTAEDDRAVDRRNAANAAWLRETFSAAQDARAVVLAFHGNPFWIVEEPRYRDVYKPFLSALQSEVAHYGKPVLAVHGNDHEFIVDQPFRGLTRMQVPGSPDVGWVRVLVTPRNASPFTFENHIVPRWKLW